MFNYGKLSGFYHLKSSYLDPKLSVSDVKSEYDDDDEEENCISLSHSFTLLVFDSSNSSKFATKREQASSTDQLKASTRRL